MLIPRQTTKISVGLLVGEPTKRRRRYPPPAMLNFTLLSRQNTNKWKALYMYTCPCPKTPCTHAKHKEQLLVFVSVCTCLCVLAYVHACFSEL